MNLRIMILIMTIRILNLLRYMILLKKSCYTLQEKATVFGISATAEVDTVAGNYDLKYLKEQLKRKVS